MLARASSYTPSPRRALGSVLFCSLRNDFNHVSVWHRHHQGSGNRDVDSHQTSTVPRYDWRHRASSRATSTTVPRGPSDGVSENGQRRNYVKRIQARGKDVQEGEAFFEEIQAYRQRFLPLLEAEQQEVEDELKARLSNWSVDKLQREGYCMTAMSAYWIENKAESQYYGRPVAAFSRGPGITLPHHRFENGAQILMTRFDPTLHDPVNPLEEEPIRGSVVASSETQMRIAFAKKFDVEGSLWRLDVGTSDIAYLRMRDAISCLDANPVEQEMQTEGSDQQVILQGTYLRDILLRSFSPDRQKEHAHVALQAPDDVAYPPTDSLDHDARLPDMHAGAFQGDMRIQSWARRYSRPNPVHVEGDPILELNPSQIRAMATMIGERLSLIQGPPGTGKTRTIIETIKLLKIHFEVPHPLLVCTYTNVAVDNLLEGLAAVGLKPLRVGHGGKVKKSLEVYTVEYQRNTHRLKPSVDSLEEEIAGLGTSAREVEAAIIKVDTGIKTSDRPAALFKRKAVLERRRIALEKRTGAAQAKLFALENEIIRDILAKADVVCTTCITSATHILRPTDFPIVFLDEASMSTEPASLIPLMKGSQHVALIGDHKQLPPVITSREAQANGLGISLFERLTEEGEVPSVMLNVQYRMHPSIARFPSGEFYNDLLQDGVVDTNGKISSKYDPPASTQLDAHTKTGNRPSVIFLDHCGNESAKNKSRVNWNEAHIVCSVIEDLLLNNERLSGMDIGVIAPYAAQISLLTRLLNTDRTYRERFKAVLGDQRALELGAIEVKTVDGFEGREKDVIIFSTVRNNTDGHIGFLADRRRLNVGLTRAKRGLFVVGSLSTLKAGKMSGDETHGNVRIGKGGEAWQRYAQYLTDEGLVMRLAGERLSHALYGNLPEDFRSRYLGDRLRDVPYRNKV